MNVYLSGPIYLNNKHETEFWRNEATKFLEQYGISTIDPCRAKATYQPEFFTCNEILFRDLKDIDKADVVLVNFNLHGGKLPIGTVCEVMYAWMKQKPVVIVSNDPAIVNHPWMGALSVKIFKDINLALTYIVNFWGS